MVCYPELGRDIEVTVVNAEGQVVAKWSQPMVASVPQDQLYWQSLFWSPDGRYLAVPCAGGTVIRDLESGSVVELRGAESLDLAWSPDSSFVACTVGESIQIWDSDTAQMLSAVNGVWPVWSPDASRLSSSSEVFDTRNRATCFEFREPDLCRSWSPDGRRLLAWRDSSVRLIDPVYGSEVYSFRSGSAPVVVASWSPSGNAILTGSADGVARIWYSTRFKERYPRIRALRRERDRLRPSIRIRLESGEVPQSLRTEYADERFSEIVRTAAFAEIAQWELERLEEW